MINPSPQLLDAKASLGLFPPMICQSIQALSPSPGTGKTLRSTGLISAIGTLEKKLGPLRETLQAAACPCAAPAGVRGAAGSLGLPFLAVPACNCPPPLVEFALLALILFCCVTSAKSFPLSVSSIRAQAEAEKGAKLIGQIGIEPIILTPLVQIEPAGQGQHCWQGELMRLC